MDFIAIGDTVVDEFITLKDAEVHCDISREHCTISMSWGDKIPYESSSLVYGVGNAANAAVAAARLGLVAGFVSNVGHDAQGEKILETFASEGVDTSSVKVNDGIPTNHHYVLSYGAERTILIKHENYSYALPENFTAPKWMYLSSASERSEAFHGELAAWLAAHKETKLAFQPGTFQIKMGTEKLAPLYAVTELVACNKEEAKRILGTKDSDIKTLIVGLHALGPKIVLITDGTNGAYCSDLPTGQAGDNQVLRVPMYPDPKPPVSRTGAGDAFTSTIVVALALDKPLAEALLWGPINSMSVVQEVGAQKGLLTRERLEEYLKNAPADYRVTVL